MQKFWSFRFWVLPWKRFKNGLLLFKHERGPSSKRCCRSSHGEAEFFFLPEVEEDWEHWEAEIWFLWVLWRGSQSTQLSESDSCCWEDVLQWSQSCCLLVHSAGQEGRQSGRYVGLGGQHRESSFFSLPVGNSICWVFHCFRWNELETWCHYLLFVWLELEVAGDSMRFNVVLQFWCLTITNEVQNFLLLAISFDREY